MEYSKQNDASLVQQAQSELRRQESLLQSVNYVATHLITAAPQQFEQTLWDSLQAIGQAANADRAYIWQNFEKDGEAFCQQTYEWSVGAPPQQGKEFTLNMPYAEVPFWHKQVIQGNTINGPVGMLPQQERLVLEPQGTVSILVIPIHIGNVAWGFIGFDDCRKPRVFSKAEEQVLRSAGILMASAIMRNDITSGLVVARDELTAQKKLLRGVNDVAALLLRDTMKEFEQRILGGLRILAQSVEADRAFIWRCHTIDGVLCASEICEWAKDIHSFDGLQSKPTNIPLDSFLPEWRDTLLKGKNLNMLARDMSEEFRNSSPGKNVLTTMNIPLLVHGEFWGLIGFDDMHRERLYTDTEMNILKSGGMLIASAINRNEMMENLMIAKEEALSSTRAKSEFLSRMSHEIRTPLNAVIGMTTLAQKSDNFERIQYCLTKIDESSRQLLSVINDVLDMSKIESGKFEISAHSFNFEKMLQHALNVVQVKLDEKHQDFVLDLQYAFERFMVSDELRLSQVLINLLTNAIKFTPDFGKITLMARVDQLEDDNAVLHVEVADTGIGIAKEQQTYLFSSFEQADGSITRRYGGSGLGLAICKKITELMGGDIWVESEKGKGSVFTFEVKIKWGSPIYSEAASLQSGLKALVVDDNPDVLDYFSNILASFGLLCDIAETGPQAVALAQKANQIDNPYHFVFVDWQMPGMSGRQTVQQLQNIVGDSTAIIVISVSDYADIEQELKQEGVHKFVAKPVLPSALYNALMELTRVPVVQPVHPDAQTERNWAGKKILLAEDVEINQEVLMALLEDTGITIECADNGKQAVEMFEAARGEYNAVLMDVQMPEMDGLMATRAIRQLPFARAKQVPIIAMTANAFKEDVDKCIAAGMNDHIAKPVEVDVLLQTLTRYLT